MTDAKPAETGHQPKPRTGRRNADKARRKPAHKLEQTPGEVGGAEGPEPTRYGDWSHNGICSDF